MTPRAPRHRLSPDACKRLAARHGRELPDEINQCLSGWQKAAANALNAPDATATREWATKTERMARAFLDQMAKAPELGLEQRVIEVMAKSEPNHLAWGQPIIANPDHIVQAMTRVAIECHLLAENLECRRGGPQTGRAPYIAWALALCAERHGIALSSGEKSDFIAVASATFDALDLLVPIKAIKAMVAARKRLGPLAFSCAYPLLVTVKSRP